MTSLLPRPEVRAFAQIMERKLRKHDDWDGWRGVSRWRLLNLLHDHYMKLSKALGHETDPQRVAEAAADCANYAMMIADVAGGLTLTEPATGLTSAGLRDLLAAIEHERWADWQRYMHGTGTRHPDGSLTIPAELVARWDRQIATPYAELSETEQRSDMRQVDRYWPLIETAVAELDIAEQGLADWQASSMLTGASGDPAGITPAMNERQVMLLRAALDAGRAVIEARDGGADVYEADREIAALEAAIAAHDAEFGQEEG